MPEAAACGEGWSEAGDALEAFDGVMMSETVLGLESEGEPTRSRCVEVLSDFTLPARHPNYRGGEIPKNLVLSLFEDTQIEARVVYWTWNDDGSVSWVGETVAQPHGTVVITVVDGWTSATIRQGQRSWTLTPDQECGGHWLGEYEDMWEGGELDCEAPEGPNGGDGGVPAPEGPEVASVDYGVRPDHPHLTLPTIDVLVVATEGAQDRLGWVGQRHGLVGYTHNRIHELDLSFLRTERERTHRPRLVGVVVDDDLDDFDLLDGQACHIENHYSFLASEAMQDLRDESGADIVALMIATDPTGTHQATCGTGGSQGRASNANVIWDPGLNLHPGHGVFGMVISRATFDKWTFSHEVGHELGSGHEGSSVPASGVMSYSAFAGIAQQSVSGASFPYSSLVASGSAPGCRVPVFSRDPSMAGFGWLPRSTESGLNPCEEDDELTAIYEPRYALTAFGVMHVVAGRPWGEFRAEIGQKNGVPVGGVDLDVGAPGRHFYRCQGDVLFQVTGDEDPWTEPDVPFLQPDPTPCVIGEDEEHSLAEMVAFYKPATSQPFEDDLEPVVGVSPGTLGQIGHPDVTFSFGMSEYAYELSQPPGPSACTDPVVQGCDFDINPYYLEIGTSLGAEDAVSQWITVEACDPITRTCAVSPTTSEVSDGDDGPPVPLDPGTVYFGRLWTQVRANEWGYREFRLNTDVPRPAISCGAESPEFAPPFANGWSCSSAANALLVSSPLVAADEEEGFANRKTLRIHLDAGGGVIAGGRAWLAHYDATERGNPYDIVAFGRLGSGAAFCCLYTFPDDEVVGVEVRGTNLDDEISLGALGVLGVSDEAHPRYGQLGHVGAEARGGSDFVSSGTTFEVRSYVHGGLLDDVIVLGSRTHGYAKGEGHADWMLAHTERRTGAFPAAMMHVDGGGAADTIIAQYVDAGRDYGSVDLKGGGGGNTLCTAGGLVRMVGSQPGYAGSTLFISGRYAPPFLSSYDIHPGTVVGGATAGTCGAPVHHTLHGAWAGPTCDYSPGQTVVPTGCDGWVDP